MTVMHPRRYSDRPKRARITLTSGDLAGIDIDAVRDSYFSPLPVEGGICTSHGVPEARDVRTCEWRHCHSMSAEPMRQESQGNEC